MKNNIIIISGPSGSGQDSVIEAMKNFFTVDRVITTTTRDMRPSEHDGRPYYFIDKDEFERKIKNNEFFEHSKHYNNHLYGVAKDEVERVMKSNDVVIWKVDYKGVIGIKKLLPQVKAIMLIAPNDVLRNRIKQRDGATDAYVEKRMKYTQEWLGHTDVYDYIVENNDGHFEDTIKKVKEIIENELGV